jgi:hypothetical protein
MARLARATQDRKRLHLLLHGVAGVMHLWFNAWNYGES